jgi:hypothetical protein
MCVLQSTFEETADQRSSSSIHRVLPFSSMQRFHSGGALFLTEGLGGDAGRSSAARSVARCFLTPIGAWSLPLARGIRR